MACIVDCSRRAISLRIKTMLFLIFALFPALAAAQTYTYSTLVSFPPNSQMGPANPAGQLIIDGQGNLYGTSQGGGIYAPPFGDGTIFEVTPAGVVTVLHSFDGTDGRMPVYKLTRDPQGNLYGTTVAGGTYDLGTVFKLAPDGTETVLYNFPGKGPDGNYPNYSVTLDPAGNLYGYTSFADNNFISNGGSIFKLTPQGTFSLLYEFCNLRSSCPNGYGPEGGLLRDKSGNFFGATCCYGGSEGAGTVFKMTPQGKLTVLTTFNLFGGGVISPNGPFVQNAGGDLIGVANAVYKVTRTGSVSPLYFFCNSPSCGGNGGGYSPNGLLTIDSSGNVYGTTLNGGTNDQGVAYEVTPAGTEIVLYNGSPTTPLGPSVVIDKAGNLYGVTDQGGVNSTGSIYKLTKNAD